MEHLDHVHLLQDGVPEPGGIWADLGSGTGAFTLALADLIGSGGKIFSIDRDRGALRKQKQAMRASFPYATIVYRQADFAQKLDLPLLDGVVMANSLHFERDKDPIVRLVGGYLRPGGRLILVEYDTDRGNPWVPYPLSYQTWRVLARRNGFPRTTLLRTRPSRFLGRIYSALSLTDEESWEGPAKL